MGVELRPLRPGEEKRLSETMSAAFVNDPLTEFLVPDPEKRIAKTRWFFRAAMGYCSRWGEVYTNDDQTGGAAWLTPGNTSMTTMRILRSGLWQMPFRMGFSAFSRFSNMDKTASVIHKKHVPGDHWYLLGLGTHPDSQGTGIGTAAIEMGAAKAAAAGLPVYLETNTENNVNYYTNRGFRVVEEYVIDGKLKTWAMLREPSAS